MALISDVGSRVRRGTAPFRNLGAALTQRMPKGWLREFTLEVHLEEPMTAR